MGLITSVSINGILAFYNTQLLVSEEKETLVIGSRFTVNTIDPINTWDYGSLNAISQLTECLFWYDFRNPSLPLEPLLAKSFSWDPSNMNLTLILQEDVLFHDGTPFNAEAVKWNVERWLYLTNSTGLLTTPQAPAVPSSLYFLPNGTEIIKGATVLEEYEVVIELNAPFGPFVAFLSYESNGMVSPTAHNQTEYIDFGSGDKVIGTGPFVLDHYVAEKELRMHRWDRYWRTNAFFEVIVFAYIEETSAHTQAMLAHDIDVTLVADPNSFGDFNADPTIEIADVGPSSLYVFWGYNNKLLNSTWRKAISFAYNYTYMIEEIWLDSVIRGCPVIPSGMPGHNSSVQANLPTINITYARELMQDMGFGLGWDTTYPGTSELNWTSANFFSDAFLVSDNETALKIRLNPNSVINRDMNDLAFANFHLIGIEAVDQSISYSEFMNFYINDRDGIHMWIDAFGPDYNDPYSMFIAIYDPDSYYNGGQVNDTQLMQWLDDAVNEPDTDLRNDIYKKIQWYLFEVETVQSPLYSRTLQYVHSTDIQGIPFNSLERIYLWPAYRV